MDLQEEKWLKKTEKLMILTKLFLVNLSTDDFHLARIDKFPPEKENKNTI